jgi:DNA processing protein
MNKLDALVVYKIKGIGNKSQVALFEFCRANNISSFEDLRSFDLNLLAPLKRVAKPLLSFLDSDDYLLIRDEVSGLLEKWSALSIEIIIYGSTEYPTQLTELDDPPAFLFCKGDKTLLTDLKSIAVIGTRENTRVGKLIATKTVGNFVSNGYCVVSGLAIGIDTIAHQATIDNSGKTIAVLVDIEKVSPAKNKDLANLILESGGLLLSENPPNTNVIPAFFVKRDRIQAGLSLAVFAIETSIDGGTMHAVKTANDLGRNVYVPNAVAAGYSDLSDKRIAGTQMLAESGRAISYTKDSYLQIQDDLEGLLNSSLESSRKPDLFS